MTNLKTVGAVRERERESCSLEKKEIVEIDSLISERRKYIEIGRMNI